METPVHGIVDTYHSNIAHYSGGEEQLLPRPTEVLRAIHNCHPLLLVQRDLNDIRVGPMVKTHSTNELRL